MFLIHQRRILYLALPQRLCLHYDRRALWQTSESRTVQELATLQHLSLVQLLIFLKLSLKDRLLVLILQL